MLEGGCDLLKCYRAAYEVVNHPGRDEEETVLCLRHYENVVEAYEEVEEVEA